MNDFRSPLHLGGPLGLAGLAMLAGATELIVMSGAVNDTPARAPGPQAAAMTADTGTVVADLPHGGHDLTPPPPVNPLPDAAGDPLPVAEPANVPAELPAKAETRDVAPAPVKIAQADTAEGAELVYIVRIKGEPEIDIISRNFRKDPAAAEQAWKDLQARHPVLKEFYMVGASYSGEIRLAYRLAPGRPATRAAIDEVKARIMQIETVSYADPDYVAHPGKEIPG